MRKYKTIQGDTWDIIAYKMYKNEKLISLLIQKNEQYAKYVKFPAGLVLNIPEIETSSPASLPPWKI